MKFGTGKEKKRSLIGRAVDKIKSFSDSGLVVKTTKTVGYAGAEGEEPEKAKTTTTVKFISLRQIASAVLKEAVAVAIVIAAIRTFFAVRRAIAAMKKRF